MQLTVLTKRARSQEKPSQHELQEKKIQVSKVEDQDISMAEPVK